ncbi:MAG: hypothetical protein KC933_25725, partial [Myxococcales bacterium]|nr:hypothetical protein [Myxococcales bacterium]
GSDPTSAASVPDGDAPIPNDPAVLTGESVELVLGGAQVVDGGEIVVIPDADGDGAADAYETLYGYDPTNPADGASDDDGDGIPMWRESRLGTDPKKADTDGDGVRDAEDPSPSCRWSAPEDDVEALRRQVALRVAGLEPSPHGAWQDLSPRCLPLALAGGPLWRPLGPKGAGPDRPGLSQLTVEVLQGELREQALQEARASGQLVPSTSEALALIRYAVRHGPLDGEGATLIFVRGPDGWRPVGEVRRWIS